MYLKTLTASVWLDAEDSAAVLQLTAGCVASDMVQVDPPLPPRERRASQVLVAKRPFQGSLGRYIALKCIAAKEPGAAPKLLVAVANKSPTEKGPWWVSADKALTEREAARWAREGF